MFRVQSNARRIMIVKDMHKCHKHHAILHKLCTWFGKNELKLYLKSKNFYDWGRPPLNTPVRSPGLSFNDLNPVIHVITWITGLLLK